MASGEVRPPRINTAIRLATPGGDTFEYVIEGLQKVCGHSRQKAFLLAAEIDAQGRALVWSGAKEVAELKRDQIRGLGPDHFAPQPVTFPLGVYIEPLP